MEKIFAIFLVNSLNGKKFSLYFSRFLYRAILFVFWNIGWVIPIIVFFWIRSYPPSSPIDYAPLPAHVLHDVIVVYERAVFPELEILLLCHRTYLVWVSFVVLHGVFRDCLW